MLPQFEDCYAARCAAHQRWLASPMQLGIPLLCTERKWEDLLLAPSLARRPAHRLDQLAVPMRAQQTLTHPPALDGGSYLGQAVALATLIEYAVATYGRVRLPTLVAGLGRYERWETLIPTVYGVSSAQFEAGWQVYLATHYSVALNTFRQ